MAELNSNALANITAATSALIITESMRLVRNYKYYNNISEDSTTRDQLINKVRQIRKLAFTLENLMNKNEADEAPFLVSVAGSINNIFEEVHRKILFYDADLIVKIIPLIDKQRLFWKAFIEPEFYDDQLIKKLEHTIPDTLSTIEKNLIGLPPFASL